MHEPVTPAPLVSLLVLLCSACAATTAPATSHKPVASAASRPTAFRVRGPRVVAKSRVAPTVLAGTCGAQTLTKAHAIGPGRYVALVAHPPKPANKSCPDDEHRWRLALHLLAAGKGAKGKLTTTGHVAVGDVKEPAECDAIVPSFTVADVDRDGHLEVVIQHATGCRDAGQVAGIETTYALSVVDVVTKKRTYHHADLCVRSSAVSPTVTLRHVDLDADKHPDLLVSVTTKTISDVPGEKRAPQITCALWRASTDSYTKLDARGIARLPAEARRLCVGAKP